MSGSHKYYLSLGSNVEPLEHIAEAIKLLQSQGFVGEASSIWESHAVGSKGPNFLNLCVSFVTPLTEEGLARHVIKPIETKLGRVRHNDRNAPRTMDIDIVLVDGLPVNPERWTHAFVILPMAELLPRLRHPTLKRFLSEVAKETRSSIWIVQRPELFKL